MLTKRSASAVAVKTAQVLLSLTFLFSGFVKAVDPWGTAYKLGDYAAWCGLECLQESGWLLAGSICLAAFEFFVGACLLVGVMRRFSSAASLVLMVLMTPLTLILAIWNPVHDCGCFGDALLLTNWQTFGKNTVLLLLAIIVFVGRKSMYRLIPMGMGRWACLWAAVYIGLLMAYSLRHLPPVDFRPYKAGVNIPEAMQVPPGADLPEYESLFVMTKDGEERTFTAQTYPDSSWTFVRAEHRLVKAGAEPAITDFSLSDEQGNDVTDRLLSDGGLTFVLVSPDLERASRDNIDQIALLGDLCEDYGLGLCALSASGADIVSHWRQTTGAMYPVYTADPIVLKTIVRANPGVLLLRGGTILNKWNHRDLPSLMSDIGKTMSDLEKNKSDFVLSKRDIEQALTDSLSKKTGEKWLSGWIKWAMNYVIPLIFIIFAYRIRYSWKKNLDRTKNKT